MLIKTLYLSVDPAQRCQMYDDTGVDYISPWKLNDVIHGLIGSGVVVESKNEDFKVGMF